MDLAVVTFVTACTALVSAVGGPLTTVLVGARQVRASVVSSNRERWVESLRDSLAEYGALCLSAALLQEASRRTPVEALREDPQLARLVERVATAKNKVQLIVNPARPEQEALQRVVNAAYRELLTGSATAAVMTEHVDALTQAGRTVLRFEWDRVKHGD